MFLFDWEEFQAYQLTLQLHVYKFLALGNCSKLRSIYGKRPISTYVVLISSFFVPDSKSYLFRQLAKHN